MTTPTMRNFRNYLLNEAYRNMNQDNLSVTRKWIDAIKMMSAEQLRVVFNNRFPS